MQSQLKIKDLISYAMSAQRLDGTYYHGSPDAYREDRNNIKRAKRAAKKAADFYWYYSDEPLLVGEYSGTRLLITEKMIEYTAGQHPPTEIWWALEDYFTKMRMHYGRVKKGLNKWIWQESSKTVRTEPENYYVVAVDYFCASGSTDGALDRDRVANLIAAAPEMLEALEKCISLLESIEDETGYCTAVTQIDGLKLIAKAKGEK